MLLRRRRSRVTRATFDFAAERFDFFRARFPHHAWTFARYRKE